LHTHVGPGWTDGHCGSNGELFGTQPPLRHVHAPVVGLGDEHPLVELVVVVPVLPVVPVLLTGAIPGGSQLPL
jgi:hypothetical protein